MFTKLLTLSVLFVSASCLSIGTVSVQNVTKRETNAEDHFPDWVPFKNKHGDELGEFVPVGNKNKIKKRLAPPINFVMRAEPEGDDYYDKGAGGDNEDYYEKKDWSDLNRPVADRASVKINHTDISDIDGVVDILTKRPLSPILEALNNAREVNTNDKNLYPPVNEDVEESDIAYGIKETVTTAKPTQEKTGSERLISNAEEKPEDKTEEKSEEIKEELPTQGRKEKEKEHKENKSNEQEENQSGEEYDDDTEKPKKSNPEEDRENEEKKAKILSSVDELKERHAEEQRELSERIKGQNMYNDEFGKDVSSKTTPHRFGQESSEEHIQWEKQRRANHRKPVTKPDYDEYEDSNGSLEDKYKINVLKSDPPSVTTESYRIRKSTTDAYKKGQRIETGKLSVFKNPQLYMIYDDNEETTIQPITPTHTRGPHKFSSRYTTTPSLSTDDRISLVPVDSKEGEPTLFFPKPRKNKSRKTKMTTIPPTDSFVAETVTDNYKETKEYDTNAPYSTLRDTTEPNFKTSDVTAPESDLRGSDTTGSDTGPITTGSGIGPDSTETDTTGADSTGADNIGTKSTGPDSTGTESTGPDSTGTASTGPDSTGTDAIPTNTNTVTDAIPAYSDHKKEKSKDYSNKKGGGREHHSEHSAEHEEHGKKAYEGHHEDKKASKGHHDKENHLGKYDDHGGVNKHHSEESGHYGDHNHEEHGKKHAEYEESGKHSKGHSTKGSHDVHKKEEYEKKVEFFEEDGDSGEEEKHGGYNHDKEHSEGGRFKNGKLRAGHEHHAKGESGHFDEGGHHLVNKGHKQASGHDSHGKHGHKQFHQGGKEGGKKWVYHHGYPAKTANLVVIDRRGDQYYHGPHYYG